jgi:hypothetical protein
MVNPTSLSCPSASRARLSCASLFRVTSGSGRSSLPVSVRAAPLSFPFSPTSLILYSAFSLFSRVLSRSTVMVPFVSWSVVFTFVPNRRSPGSVAFRCRCRPSPGPTSFRLLSISLTGQPAAARPVGGWRCNSRRQRPPVARNSSRLKGFRGMAQFLLPREDMPQEVVMVGAQFVRLPGERGPGFIQPPRATRPGP